MQLYFWKILHIISILFAIGLPILSYLKQTSCKDLTNKFHQREKGDFKEWKDITMKLTND